MNKEQISWGIPAEEWAATPESVRQFVLTVMQANEQLRERIGKLEERLNQNSQNSSKPPSSDGPGKAVRPPKATSGRKRGGQPGHEGHTRWLKASEEVDAIVDVRPTSCSDCGALLLGDDPSAERRQVTEVPRVEPEITEYRRHSLCCMACGAVTTAEWPAEMPSGSFGPRVQAVVGYLSGRMSLSQRDIAEGMAALYHVEMAVGSIPAMQAAVSEALAKPVEAAQTYIQQQPAVNVDETGWRQENKRAWLWLAATPLVAIFLVMKTRGAQGVHSLLGDTFNGIVGSDRWSAYNWLDPKRRQLCWAHLIRDFQKLVDRGGESARIGQDLLTQAKELFHLWQRVRDGTLTRTDFAAEAHPICTRVHQLLLAGAELEHPQTRQTCRNLLKVEDALWTFVTVDDVEPTNNLAERSLRRAVLWRKRSFGTQSTTGSLFVARILTTVTTLRMQQRDVLDFLTDACAAANLQHKHPSLLPIDSTT
jgi:transposase